MKGLPATGAISYLAVNTQETGENGVITLAASTTGERHIIDWVMVSYLLAAATGNITITNIANKDEAAVSWTQDVILGGEHVFYFDPPLRGLVNTAVVITAIDGSTTKKTMVSYR